MDSLSIYRVCLTLMYNYIICKVLKAALYKHKNIQNNADTHMLKAREKFVDVDWRKTSSLHQQRRFIGWFDVE